MSWSYFVPTMEEEFEDVFGGHDIEFVDELSECQKCSICLLAMRDPVQTQCGHRFCETCLMRSFSEGDQICPQDREPILDGTLFRDGAHKRNILSLDVKCKQSERGCDWTGELRYYEEHSNICEYEDVSCDYCPNGVQRRLLNEHTTECQNRIVQCEYCEEEIVFRLRESHEDNDCARFPLECRQECGYDIPREEMESHVRDECAMTVVFCPYKQGGCTFQDERGCLNDHIWNSTPEHLSQTWSKLLKTTDELEVLKDQIEELRLENKGLRNDVATTRQQLENNKEEMSSLKRLIETVREHKVEATEDKRPDTPLNSRKQLSPLKTLEPIKQKSRPKSAMSLGRAHEKKETDYSMYPQSPSSSNPNRPKTAAATLPMDTGNFDNENGNGKSPVKSPSFRKLNRPKTAAATLLMCAGQIENTGKPLVKSSPSFRRRTRPTTAAATLPVGAGQIDNENVTAFGRPCRQYQDHQCRRRQWVLDTLTMKTKRENLWSGGTVVPQMSHLLTIEYLCQ